MTTTFLDEVPTKLDLMEVSVFILNLLLMTTALDIDDVLYAEYGRAYTLFIN